MISLRACIKPAKIVDFAYNNTNIAYALHRRYDAACDFLVADEVGKKRPGPRQDGGRRAGDAQRGGALPRSPKSFSERVKSSGFTCAKMGASRAADTCRITFAVLDTVLGTHKRRPSEALEFSYEAAKQSIGILGWACLYASVSPLLPKPYAVPYLTEAFRSRFDYAALTSSFASMSPMVQSFAVGYPLGLYLSQYVGDMNMAPVLKTALDVVAFPLVRGPIQLLAVSGALLKFGALGVGASLGLCVGVVAAAFNINVSGDGLQSRPVAREKARAPDDTPQREAHHSRHEFYERLAAQAA